MSLSKITTRFSRTVLTQCRNSVFFFGGHEHRSFYFLSDRLTSCSRASNEKLICGHGSFLHRSILNSSALQWFEYSSSASPEPNEKEKGQSGNGKEVKENNEAASDIPHTEATSSEGTSESDSESDISEDDLVKLVAEKEQLLVVKQQELEQMKDKVLRSFAEMENVKERTRRDSENAKKFAIQNFAKSLLDVADNLGRASSATKESFSKIDASKDTTGAVKQLKTLLEGVEMTEKQLVEAFKKFGVEKYNPVDEEFDPNRHNAVFQVPDGSKPANHVGVVLKAGYMLHDRVLRPAEVGVTVAVEEEEGPDA